MAPRAPMGPKARSSSCEAERGEVGGSGARVNHPTHVQLARERRHAQRRHDGTRPAQPQTDAPQCAAAASVPLHQSVKLAGLRAHLLQAKALAAHELHVIHRLVRILGAAPGWGVEHDVGLQGPGRTQPELIQLSPWD